MDADFFIRVLKHEKPALYEYIYNTPFSCLVPKSTTIHEIERNLFITPVLSVKEHAGYGWFGDSYDEVSPDVTSMVDGMFEPYEEVLSKKDYGLNHKVSVMITIIEMARLYNDGNFVYLNKEEDLRKVYGLLESFVSYKLSYFKGPNTSNEHTDTDLALLDNLATSMVNVYEKDDSELYYHEDSDTGRRKHLTHKPTTSNKDIKVVLRKDGNKVAPKISLDRLKELGLD